MERCWCSASMVYMCTLWPKQVKTSESHWYYFIDMTNMLIGIKACEPCQATSTGPNIPS